MLIQFLSRRTLLRRRLYRTLRHLGLRPPVGCFRKMDDAHLYMDFRRKPGFTSSPPRMFMFGTTTFMFILGIIALVLETTLGFQQMQLFLNPDAGGVWSSYRTNVVIAVGATITRLMVRSNAIRLTQLTASIQYILSDIICAWRAVVLWNRDKRVIAILLLFILGTTGT